MKNPILYAIKIKTTTKKCLLTTSLLIYAITAIPSYAEITLKQAIEQERAQEIADNLDDKIQDAVIDHLAQLEIEAQQKNQTKDTNKTLETKQTIVQIDTPPTTQIDKTAPTTETKQATKKAIPNTPNQPQVAMVEKEDKEDKDKNRNKPTSTEITKKNIIKTKMTTVGWIYLGRFQSGQWENPTLGAKKLPKVKQHYKIIATSVNVRDRLPKKDALGELVLGTSIRQLVDKQEVALLQLKRSGRNGHYWAKIGVIGK